MFRLSPWIFAVPIVAIACTAPQKGSAVCEEGTRGCTGPSKSHRSSNASSSTSGPTDVPEEAAPGGSTTNPKPKPDNPTDKDAGTDDPGPIDPFPIDPPPPPPPPPPLC